MRDHSPRRGGAAAMLIVLGTIPVLSACSGEQAEAAKLEAVTVVQVGDVNEITLSARASQRLGLTTSKVVRGAGGQLTVPHSSLLYDSDGTTFVYTSTKDLVFQRTDVKVLRITGGTVVLTAGPAAGTSVVTVGGSELFGVDTGVGGGH